MFDPCTFTRIAILGDLHGHLQLGLCALARLQRETAIPISAILLAGDIGCFSEETQLDSATRAHARHNPCELEFLTQWSMTPPPPWLDAIFQPHPDGLGLTCPIVMVHGNHEGFAHLATRVNPRRFPTTPVPIDALPTIDTLERISYLPSGFRTVLPSGHTLAGIGGIETGQRRAKYHPLAYIDDNAVNRLLTFSPVDLLLTHQGPAAVQGDHGSPTLDPFLDRLFARFWFHGHSTPILAPTQVNHTLVVPLGDVTFTGRNAAAEPGRDGWCLLDLHPDGTHTLHRDPPPFWRDFCRHLWHETPGGRLVHPDLAHLAR